MRVIAVLNRKGGVGKTTSAVSIASALALAGHRTLLVDLDPQGSAGAALGLRADEGSAELFRAKGRPRPGYHAHEALFRLGVIPADDALADVEIDLLGDARRRARLGTSLAATRDHFRYAVLDAPPALGGLSDAALLAADAVVVPVAADYLALDALRATLAAVRAVEKRRGRAYAPLALLPTFVDRRRASADAVALLRDRFGAAVLAAEIPRSARFDAAALAATPVGLAAPRSAPALAYAAAAAELAAAVDAERPSRAPKRPGVKRFVRADMRDALGEIRRRETAPPDAPAPGP